MPKLFRVFFWGMLVSFLGSLPLGTMNVTVTQLSVHNGIKAGFLFAAGAMIVEVIIVRIALVTMKWLARQHKLFLLLEYVTTSLILFLAIASFVAAYKMTGFATSFPARAVTPFWLGVFLSATNPLHIPFWLGWSTVLMNKNILRPHKVEYNWYVSGIGLGTMMGFALFICGGNFLVGEIQQHQILLNCIIGIVLAITAAVQIKKMMKVPSATRYRSFN
jgi:threonine/homoserine/homoserine lactone efflux protein